MRLWQSIATRIDALWGYDVFVAHRRVDGAAYAQALHDQLTAENVSCFIDRNVYKPGDYLPAATQRHAAKSTVLVVVASPGLLETRNPDWVKTELDVYRATHRNDDSKVIVIDFAATVAGNPQHPIAAEFTHFVRVPATKDDLQRAPVPSIIEAVKNQVGGRRVERVRLRWFQGIAVVLFVFAIATGVAAYFAYQQLGAARARLGQALGARAQQLLEQPVTKETAAVIPALAVQSWEISHGADAWNALQRLPWAGAVVPLGEYGQIEAFDFSPDSRLAATGTKDAVRLFAVEKGMELRCIKHAGWVHAVTFSPDGRLLATGGGIFGGSDEPPSGFVRVFHTDDGNEVPSEIYNYKSRVLQVAFNQSGRYLASVADDGTARLTRMDDGTSEPILDSGVGVRKIAFSPDGALLAAVRVDGGVWIRILETREKYPLFYKPNTEISALAFGPGNSRAGTPLIAIGTKEKGSCPESCSASFIRILKATKGGGQVNSIRQGETLVNALAFSSDGSWLASAANDRAVKIVDLRKASEEAPGPPFELAFPDSVSALAFSPDSRLLAAGSVDGTARLVAVVDGRVVAVIDNGSGVMGKSIQPGSTVNVLKFSPNGRLLGIAGEFPRAQLIPLVVGLGEEVFLFHDYAVRAVAFSADGRFFASGGEDGVARLVALDKPTKATSIFAPSGISALAFGPESMLFIGGEDGVVTFQPAQTGKPIPFHPRPSIVVPNNVVAMTFSSDYTLFALGSLDGTVQLMTVDGWQAVKKWPEDRASPSGLTTSRGGESLGGLAFGGANRFFAGGIGFFQGKGAARIWDIGRRTVLPEIATDSWVKAVAFSPDGSMFATVEENGRARIYWPADGTPPKDLPFQADTSVAFSPAGRFIATAGSDGMVRIATTRGQVWASVQHPKDIAMMAFSGDGQMLATASYADVRLLEVPSGRELARVTHSAKITALAFSPNSRFLATGGGTDPGQPTNPRTPHHDDRSARVWNTDLEAIFQRLCQGQGRNLGFAEWRRQFGDLPWQPTCKSWPIPADVKSGQPAAGRLASPVTGAKP